MRKCYSTYYDYLARTYSAQQANNVQVTSSVYDDHHDHRDHHHHHHDHQFVVVAIYTIKLQRNLLK